jgi:uncharacterized protein YciI
MADLFLVLCNDNPDMLALRQENRPKHMAHIQSLGDRLKMAGPQLDAADGDPCGSVLIIEGESAEDVEGFMKRDPFWQAGIFKDMAVRPFTAVIGDWVPEDVRLF